MAKKIIGLEMLVIMLVFVTMFVGCDGDPTDNNGGIFLLTNIPAEYDGKYALFEERNSDGVLVLGCINFNLSTGTGTFPKISNGQARIPVWLEDRTTDSFSKYHGDDAFDEFRVKIVNKPTYNKRYDDGEEFWIAGVEFESVVFSNGNATKSANDGNIFIGNQQ